MKKGDKKSFPTNYEFKVCLMIIVNKDIINT